LYTRKLTDAPEELVTDGKPVFGTFKNHPNRLDIRGVKRPYGILPMPTFITNFRIKSRISFYFDLGEYIGNIEFFDAKIFGYVEVCFWNKTTKQKFSYRSVMGPRKRFVPHEIESPATIICYKKSRYIRISWDRKHDKLAVIFNLHGDSVRPSANAAMIAHFSDPKTTEITTNIPAPTQRRCSALFLNSLKLHGAITLVPKTGKPITMEDSEGLSLFNISRTFLKFRTHGEFITGLGFIKDSPVSFKLSSGSQDPVDSDKYNENALFYNGTVTPLPPIRITHPFGMMEKWIIQDTENMVDLTFTPISESTHTISAFFIRTQYHTIYGSYEGALLTSSGEKIAIHNLQGLAKRYLIRL